MNEHLRCRALPVLVIPDLEQAEQGREMPSRRAGGLIAAVRPKLVFGEAN